MRVLQVIADGRPGGGTTHVLQILSHLEKKFPPALITQAGSYLLGEASALNIPTFGLDFFRSRLDLLVPGRIRQIITKHGFDLVHVHGGRAAFFCALAKLRIPVIYTVHAYHFIDKSPLVRRLAIQAERLSSKRASRVIFVSDHDARLADKHRLVAKGVSQNVIPCSVDLAKIPAANPNSLTHIGFIGRLEEQKNPLLFLDVVERLPGYKVSIVGGGSLDGVVRAEITKRGLSDVCVLGPLSHQETLRALTTFGVLVMTSRWEGLPILCLEAMAAGVPVVATNVGGLSEAIQNGRSGVLVNSRSPEEIADSVKRLVQNPDLRGMIIKNGRARVKQLFSEEKMLQSLVEIYLEAVPPDSRE